MSKEEEEDYIAEQTITINALTDAPMEIYNNEYGGIVIEIMGENFYLTERQVKMLEDFFQDRKVNNNGE